ncbi:TMEM175 family protein [Cellulomonas sp. PhB150]|uniref:TMEM175 family protein n=1 Tax=Cellulomonas sp. PhB150 TaxID=2485188 RepID=UPI000F90E059|nr:TMEM175 family protein [Cellulomonas sp. PhB150]ROS31768.1 putative membrane protein [Cellulomonas sp. PhB150]
MAPDVRTDRGLDRLVNFTDAAVAIAITILVLPLVDIASDSGDTRLGDVLADHADTFIAFLVTFAVIARLWVAHHQLFERLRSYDSVVVWLVLLWLGCIVMLPFAAQELSNLYSSDPWVFVLYIGLVTVSSASLALVSVRIARRPELRASDSPDAHDAGRWITTILLLAALGLVLLVPWPGMFWLLLLLLSGPVEKLWARRR